MITIQIILFSLLGLLIIWQVFVWIGESRQKWASCRAAVNYCKINKKPLLIAGGPYGGRPFRRWLHLPAHRNGDACIDISRNAIAGHPNGVVADVVHLPFKDKVFGAVFASHLLEHLPNSKDAKQALIELNRVADTVYLAYPSRQSIPAWIIPDHHLWVWQKGNMTFFKERGHDRKEVQIETGGTRI